MPGESDVFQQGAQDAFRGRVRDPFSEAYPGGIEPGKKAGGGGFGITFDPGDLAGDEQVRVIFYLQGGGQEFRRIHVGVPMHLAQSDELRLMEGRNEAKNPLLFGVNEICLTTDEVEHA